MQQRNPNKCMVTTAVVVMHVVYNIARL